MEKKKKIKLLIIGSILLLLLVLGGVYAWLTFTTGNIIVAGNTHCFTINYTKGADITGNIGAIKEEDYLTGNTIKLSTAMGFTPISMELDRRCNKVSGIGVLELNVESLSTAFTSEGNSYGSLKYVVAEYNPSLYTDSTIQYLKNQTFTYIRRGIISGTGTMDIHTEYLNPGEKHDYLVIIYIDKNEVGDDIIGANITATGTARADQFVANSINDFTYSTTTYNGITVPENTILLTGYTGTSNIVNIPSTYTIDGTTYNVMVYSDTSNNVSTFSNNSTITNVNFANGVKFSEYDGTDLIQNSADSLFKGCTSLVSAPKLPNSITSMNNTYEGCTSLTNIEYIPNSTTSMLSTFKGCTSLEGYIRIPNESVTFDSDTFNGITNNIVVEVPANSDTQYNMEVLANENITVEPLGKLDLSTPITDFLYVIGGDTSITSLPLYTYSDCINNSEEPTYTSKEVYNYDISSNPITIPSNTILLTGYTGNSKDIVIPDTYTIDGTTYNVVIPSSIYDSIFSSSGGGAVASSYEYSSSNVSENRVMQMSSSYNNVYQSKVKLLKGSTNFCDNLPYGLLSNNTTLETISIGDGVVPADYGKRGLRTGSFIRTFDGDTSLTTVYNLPSYIGYMDYSTFYGCTNLEGTIRVNSCNVTFSNLFDGLTKNITLEVPKNSITAASAYNVFGNCGGSEEELDDYDLYPGKVSPIPSVDITDDRDIFRPIGGTIGQHESTYTCDNITVVEFENDMCSSTEPGGSNPR